MHTLVFHGANACLHTDKEGAEQPHKCKEKMYLGRFGAAAWCELGDFTTAPAAPYPAEGPAPSAATVHELLELLLGILDLYMC